MKRRFKPLLIGIFMAAAGPALADSITFYEGSNFGGRQFTADRPVTNLARSGFNDRVTSAVVHAGRWEICVDAEFSGGCSILAPGAYPNLGQYADRISSLRPVDDAYYGRRYGDRGRYGDARATLFEGPNLSGRAYPIVDRIQNLGSTGFNDRATSLRVESGYWIFCSDADFRGDCRTFGPGDYAYLPGLNNMISSGRQIADQYPYSSRPEWRDSYRQSQSGYPIRTN